MRSIALVLVCLACVGHGSRVNTTSKHKQDGSHAQRQNSHRVGSLARLETWQSKAQDGVPKRLNALAMLLLALSNAALAFNPGHGLVSGLGPRSLPGSGHGHKLAKTNGVRAGTRSARSALSRIEQSQNDDNDQSSMTPGFEPLSIRPSLGFDPLAHAQGPYKPFSLVVSLPEPRPIDLSASTVVSSWMRIASQRIAKSSKEFAYNPMFPRTAAEKQSLTKAGWTHQTLLDITRDINKWPPDEVLALVTKDSAMWSDQPSDILCMATVRVHLPEPPTERMAKRLNEIAKRQGLTEAGDTTDEPFPPRVKIDTVVASPMPGVSAAGLGKELLLQIVRRAATSGHLVLIRPANERLRKYYQEIGFETVDASIEEMVYSKAIPEVADFDLEFEMASLRVA